MKTLLKTSETTQGMITQFLPDFSTYRETLNKKDWNDFPGVQITDQNLENAIIWNATSSNSILIKFLNYQC